ncbi:MAG: Hsp20/alpha crystallin family protein [Pseudomonadota bacterium]
MDLVSWKPFGELANLRQEMERLWNRSLGEGLFERPGVTWSPNLDVSEKDDTVLVRAELPGLEPPDITVSVSGDVLTIRGEKKSETEKDEENVHYSERYFGSFSRSLKLSSPVDPGKVEASFKNGVLSITLPKTGQAASKRIDVKAG